MWQFLERMALVVVALLAIVIGAGAAILVTNAVDQYRAEVCIENSKLEGCEEEK